VRNIAVKTFGKGGLIVGVDLRVVTGARHRDVCEATIDEFLSPLFGVHMDKHSNQQSDPDCYGFVTA